MEGLIARKLHGSVVCECGVRSDGSEGMERSYRCCNELNGWFVVSFVIIGGLHVLLRVGVHRLSILHTKEIVHNGVRHISY